MERRRVWAVLVSLCTGLAACRSGAAGGGAREASRARCPMTVPGTRVSFSETDDGVRLTFTTRAGGSDELLRRVEAVARAHNRIFGEGGERPPLSPKERTAPDRFPPSRATVVPLREGARLIFSPANPARLRDLERAARSFASRLAAGDCSEVDALFAEAARIESDSD